MAASLGALVVDDPAEGISAAINEGLAARTTEQYYAWVGDDDLFRPRGLRTLAGHSATRARMPCSRSEGATTSTRTAARSP